MICPRTIERQTNLQETTLDFAAFAHRDSFLRLTAHAGNLPFVAKKLVPSWAGEWKDFFIRFEGFFGKCKICTENQKEPERCGKMQ